MRVMILKTKLILLIFAMSGGLANALQFPKFEQSLLELQEVLKPHVVTLDRNLILFRYEAKDPERFNPHNEQDLINRVSPWSKRFFDESIVGNPDGGGPGLYASTDPTATATWGITTPGLFVLTLQKQSNVLIGDMPEVSQANKKRLSEIYSQMNCGKNSYQDGNGSEFSQVVVRFRNAENPECRRLMIEVIRRLEIKAITYSFYSSPLANCRATGTAINIVWPDAMALSDINYYSDDVTIEGKKQLTPFVKKLFDEGKTYFFTQTAMANESMRDSLKNAFGFFNHVEAIDDISYERWKAHHILRCGPKWPTELPDLRAILNLNSKANASEELQDLYITTALAYKKRKFNLMDPTTQLAESEFHISRMRKIKHLLYQQMQTSRVQLSENRFNKLFDQENINSLQKMAGLLGESYPVIPKEFNSQMMKALEQVNERDLSHPLLIATLLQKAGIGPRMLKLVFNQNQFQQGNVPILEGDIPSRMNQDASGLLQHNRKLIGGILRQCLNMYSDPTISNKEVYESPCGLYNTTYQKKVLGQISGT